MFGFFLDRVEDAYYLVVLFVSSSFFPPDTRFNID